MEVTAAMPLPSANNAPTNHLSASIRSRLVELTAVAGVCGLGPLRDRPRGRHRAIRTRPRVLGPRLSRDIPKRVLGPLAAAALLELSQQLCRPVAFVRPDGTAVTRVRATCKFASELLDSG